MPSKRTPASPRERKRHPELMTIADAAEESGLSLSAIYKRIEEGTLACEEVGTTKLVRRAEIAALKKRPPGPKPAK